MRLVFKFKDGTVDKVNIDNPSFSGQTKFMELLQKLITDPEGIIQIEDRIRKFDELYSVEIIM